MDEGECAASDDGHDDPVEDCSEGEAQPPIPCTPPGVAGRFASLLGAQRSGGRHQGDRCATLAGAADSISTPRTATGATSEADSANARIPDIVVASAAAVSHGASDTMPRRLDGFLDLAIDSSEGANHNTDCLVVGDVSTQALSLPCTLEGTSSGVALASTGIEVTPPVASTTEEPETLVEAMPTKFDARFEGASSQGGGIGTSAGTNIAPLIETVPASPEMLLAAVRSNDDGTMSGGAGALHFFGEGLEASGEDKVRGDHAQSHQRSEPVNPLVKPSAMWLKPAVPEAHGPGMNGPVRSTAAVGELADDSDASGEEADEPLPDEPWMSLPARNRELWECIRPYAVRREAVRVRGLRMPAATLTRLMRLHPNMQARTAEFCDVVNYSTVLLLQAVARAAIRKKVPGQRVQFEDLRQACLEARELQFLQPLSSTLDKSALVYAARGANAMAQKTVHVLDVSEVHELEPDGAGIEPAEGVTPDKTVEKRQTPPSSATAEKGTRKRARQAATGTAGGKRRAPPAVAVGGPRAGAPTLTSFFRRSAVGT